MPAGGADPAKDRAVSGLSGQACGGGSSELPLLLQPSSTCLCQDGLSAPPAHMSSLHSTTIYLVYIEGKLPAVGGISGVFTPKTRVLFWWSRSAVLDLLDNENSVPRSTLQLRPSCLL